MLAFASVWSRQPEALMRPQFYGEDAVVFYREAHEEGGLRVLAWPHRGYISAVPRLCALAAMALPLRHVPLMMAAVANAIITLPAVLLASRRFGSLVPRRELRLALALLCLGTPQTVEMFANLAHSQWFLGVLGCLTLMARPARGTWLVLDAVAILLVGLSGPAAVFLAPVAALAWWHRRSTSLRLLFLFTVLAASVQLASLFRARQHHRLPRGTSVELALRIAGGRVAYGAILGRRVHMFLLRDGESLLVNRPVVAAAGAGTICLFILAMVRGPMELRLFILYAALSLGTALMAETRERPWRMWWETLAHPSVAPRYFFASVLAFEAILVWLLSRGAVARVLAAAGIGCILLLGVRSDWRQPPRPDLDFPRFAEAYEAAPAGTVITIPTEPSGWKLRLTRR